ncbi:MAG: choice-of-anchor D domain-containing protein [Ignavibacteriales bacterium]|nr:choice-of-anchor D domain-containing protein [Ignavibacteriales bacterium]
MKTILISIITSLLFNATFSQTDYFTPSDGPFSANCRAIALDSTGNVFLGSQSGGIYKSSDGGLSWYYTSDGLTNKSVFSISVTLNNKMYVGTTMEQVFISTDHGITWSERSSLIPQDINGEPYGSVTGFAQTDNGYVYASSSQHGVFVSTDQGLFWKRMGYSLSTQKIFTNNSNHIFIVSQGGLYRSLGDSTSWLKLNLGVGGSISTAAISMDGYLYAGVAGSLYRSTDNGTLWSKIYSGTSASSIQTITSATPMTIMFISRNIYHISTDGGNSWLQQQIHPVSTSTTFGLINNGYLLAANNYGGIYRSSNNGQSWSLSNHGLNAQSVGELFVAHSGDQYALLGTRELYFCEAGSNAWNRIGDGIITTNFHDIHEHTSTTLFLGTAKGVFRSTDKGLTWNPADTATLPYRVIKLFSDTIKGTLYAGTYENGLFKSTNNGSTWNLVNNSPVLQYPRVYTFAPNGAIFAGVNQDVLRSTDQGETWATVYSVFNSQPNDIVCFGSGKVYLLTGNGLFHSDDNGLTFETVTTETVFGGRTLRKRFDNQLFIGSTTGLLRSNNAGKNWQQFSSGLINTNINTMDFDSDGYLLVGTDAGLYRGVVPERLHYYSKDSMIFGITKVGMSKYDTLVIHNPASTNVTFSSVLTTDSAFHAFIPSQTVFKSDSVIVSIQFAPLEKKDYSGFIIFNSPFGSDTIALFGKGITPELKMPSKKLVLSNVLAGRDSILYAIEIANTGDDTLSVTQVTSSHPFFSVEPYTFKLAPSKTIQQVIKFKPDTAGIFSVYLIYHNNSLSVADSIEITATGIKKAIPLFTPITMNFGKIRIDSSKSLYITITNAGNDILLLSRLDSLGSHFNNNLKSVSIAGGTSYIDTVIFQPKSFGEIVSSVYYYIMNDSSYRKISVTGYGYALATALYSPEIIDVGVLKIGGKRDTIITITNSGVDTLIVVNRRLNLADKNINAVIAPGSHTYDTLEITTTGYGIQHLRYYYFTNGFHVPDTIMVNVFGFGNPLIVFDPSSTANFYKVRTDKSKNIPIAITNKGTDTLKVSYVHSTNPSFSNRFTSFTILPFAIRYDTITFSPATIGIDSGYIIFHSNTEKGLDSLKVIGTGEYPNFWVEKNKFNDRNISAIKTALNGNILIGTTKGIFFSTDRGTSWNVGYSPDSAVQINDLMVLSNGYVLAASNNQGILRSTNNGRQWENIEDADLHFSIGSIARNNDGSLLALQNTTDASKSKLVYSMNNGVTWSPFVSGLSSTQWYSNLFVTSTGDIYVAHHSLAIIRLIRSTDVGKTWTPVTNSYDTNFVKILFESDKGLLYASQYSFATSGAYVSMDSGKHWRSLYTGGQFLISTVSMTQFCIFLFRRKIFNDLPMKEKRGLFFLMIFRAFMPTTLLIILTVFYGSVINNGLTVLVNRSS